MDNAQASAAKEKIKYNDDNDDRINSPFSAVMTLDDLPRDILQHILKGLCRKCSRDGRLMDSVECADSAKWVVAAAMSCRGMQQAASRDFWLWFLLKSTGLRLTSLSFPEDRVSLPEFCYSMARNHQTLEAQLKLRSQFPSPQCKAKAAEIASLLLSNKGRTIFVPPMSIHSPQSLRPYDGTLHYLSAIGGNGIYVVDTSAELTQMARQVLRKDFVPYNMGVYMKPYYYDGLLTLKSPYCDPEIVEERACIGIPACNNRNSRPRRRRVARVVLMTREFLESADHNSSSMSHVIKDIIKNVDIVNYAGEHYEHYFTVHHAVERLSSSKEFKTIFYRKSSEISGVPSAAVNGKYATNEIVAC